MKWDAGNLGCGQLIFDLRLRLDELQPGETLELIARDAGAPIDVPAFCRTTGHELLSGEHPVYVIRRSLRPDES